jgi:hypothetical protein
MLCDVIVTNLSYRSSAQIIAVKWNLQDSLRRMLQIFWYREVPQDHLKKEYVKKVLPPKLEHLTAVPTLSLQSVSRAARGDLVNLLPLDFLEIGTYLEGI